MRKEQDGRFCSCYAFHKIYSLRTDKMEDIMDYKNAGVDIEAGYKSVELMKKHVKETMRPEVMGGLGGFSGR